MLKLLVKFYLFFVFSFFFGSLNTHAQDLLFYSDTDTLPYKFYNYQEFTDSNSVLEFLQNQGYWNVKIDVINLSEPITAHGHLNTHYTLHQLSNINQLDKAVKQRIKSKETVYDINKEVLKHYTNKGYLFTEINWGIDSVFQNKWIGQIEVIPHDIQYIDSVIVKSESILKQKKWDRILAAKNKPATTLSAERANLRLKSLSFIELNKTSQLLITDKKNLLFIFPKKKKVNFANGILAFTNDKSNNSSGFTGNFNLHLENILKSAETFDIKWKAGNGNQDFRLKNSFKYIYKSLGIQNEVNIYKQDSTFTKTQLALGLRIDAKPQSTWVVNYQFEQSAVDDPTSTRVNYTKHLLMVSWLASNLESNYFDSKGYKIDLNAKIGNRKTSENTEAEYQLHGSLLKILPLSKTLRLVGELEHKQLIQTTILENNNFNFGGFENMKGFIENRFLTTRYTLLTPTLRFSQNNKYVAELFYQHAFIRTTDKKNERLQSFGLQFILPVKSGWFNFGVSSGRVYPEAFNFSEALIHFGVKNNL